MKALEQFKASMNKFCVRTDGFSFCNGITIREIDKSLKPEDVCIILNYLYYNAAEYTASNVDDYIEECVDKYDKNEEYHETQQWFPGMEEYEYD